jgi:hypothetical protein
MTHFFAIFFILSMKTLYMVLRPPPHLNPSLLFKAKKENIKMVIIVKEDRMDTNKFETLSPPKYNVSLYAHMRENVS